MTTLTPDICVIGAGSAGLTVAAAASSFGHDVVLIERGRMGGDCLNYGCVPSKSLIAAARYAHTARSGAAFGVHAEPQIDFAAVHAHVHSVIEAIAPHDSQERFEGLGVTVLRTHARFRDAATVEADGTLIKAKRFVIATGSRPLMPQVPGLAEANPLTNESVFDLTRLPGRLAILGGGPIGCELGQAFARLGSTVSLATRGTILPREDEDAAQIVREQLRLEGVDIIENAAVESCTSAGGTTRLGLSGGRSVEGDAVLVAAGRTPNIEDLGLEAAGIAFDKRGITVDAGLRTTNRRVFAIGDVAGGLQFTHVAGHQASLAVRAIVFRMSVRYDADLMPRTTYTSPEVAQVGPTEAEAKQRDPRASAVVAPLPSNDRARTERIEDGFVKLVLDGKARLIGATIVAPSAGDMIATYALALAAKVPLKTIASFTPAYPTLSEAGKRAAVTHFAQRLDRGWIRSVLKLLKRLP